MKLERVPLKGRNTPPPPPPSALNLGAPPERFYECKCMCWTRVYYNIHMYLNSLDNTVLTIKANTSTVPLR